MTTFYFHEYAGATYNRANFDDFCKDWNYEVKARHSVYDPTTRDYITCYVADEKTASHCYTHFPHNVTMGYPVQV